MNDRGVVNVDVMYMIWFEHRILSNFTLSSSRCTYILQIWDNSCIVWLKFTKHSVCGV